MSQNVNNFLRWIAVLPGSAIAGLLALFPLHWILYQTLAQGEIISGINIDPIERILSPFAFAITFVLVGFKIAPNYKFLTSVILAFLWAVSTIASILFLPLFLPDYRISYDVRSVAFLFGLLLGLLVAWILSKRISST